MLRRVYLRLSFPCARCRMQELMAAYRKTISDPTRRISWCRRLSRPDFQENQWNEKDSSKEVRLSPAVLLLAAISRDQDNDGERQNKDVGNLLKRARQMSSRHNKEKAEQLFIEALHLAIERKNTSMVAQIQDELASLALQKGDYDKAITLFKNVVKNLIDTGLKESDVSILEVSLKLATLYATSLKHDIAINGYEWVIEKSRENLNDNEKLDEEQKKYWAFLGMALDSYGRYLFTMKRTKQALQVTKEAIEISSKLFGENDIRTLVLLNDYGAILTDCSEYFEAEKAIVKAIENAKNCKDAKHSDIAVFWVNLGSIYLKDEKSSKATEAFKNAKKEAALSKNRSLQLQVEHYITELTE